MKKRILAVLSALIIILAIIMSCGEKKSENRENIQSGSEREEEIVKIAAIKGPPAMGIVKLFSDNEEGKTLNKYSSKIVATPLWSEKTKVKALPSDFEVVTLWRLEQ